MRHFPLYLLLLATAPLQASAQSPAGAPVADPAVGTVRALWQQITAYITTVAEELPDSTYGYRPTPEVRSFAQLIGHVAGAQYLFCAAALGEAGQDEDAIEETSTTKPQLVAALKASTQYCERAYGQSDDATQARTRLFGQERTRFFALTMNAMHNAEHYGNLVTYLRLNGIVPPSSRPRS